MSLLIAPIEALTDPEITYTEKLVLLALFSFRGKDTNTVWPSINAIAERALIKDTPRISKITNSLQKKGWLTKKRKGFTGCNQYVLTVPERLSNLEDDTNLVESTNLAKIAKKGESTSSNLAKITKSNLAKIAKYKEQTNEQTIEQTNKNILSDADASNPPVEKSKPKVSIEHIEIATILSNAVKSRYPDQRINLDAWAEDVRKLMEIDKRTRDQILTLWSWISNWEDHNGFNWYSNCRTPAKLRKRKDGLQYFDLINQRRQQEANRAANQFGRNSAPAPRRPSLVERIEENCRRSAQSRMGPVDELDGKTVAEDGEPVRLQVWEPVR